MLWGWKVKRVKWPLASSSPTTTVNYAKLFEFLLLNDLQPNPGDDSLYDTITEKVTKRFFGNQTACQVIRRLSNFLFTFHLFRAKLFLRRGSSWTANALVVSFKALHVSVEASIVGLSLFVWSNYWAERKSISKAEIWGERNEISSKLIIFKSRIMPKPIIEIMRVEWKRVFAFFLVSTHRFFPDTAFSAPGP